MGEPLKVGDTLLFVSNTAPPRLSNVVLTKVGRKWVTVGEGIYATKFDASTLDEGGANREDFGGRLFRNAEACEAHERKVALAAAWRKFAEGVRWCQMPEGVDMAWIEAASERLGISK